MECESCKEVLMSWEDAELVDKAEKDAIEEALQNKPVKDFITEKETAAILGKTKQAVSKHPRIKRGFIFQTRFDERKMYLRESVEKYKKNGDGRFRLVNPIITKPVNIRSSKTLDPKTIFNILLSCYPKKQPQAQTLINMDWLMETRTQEGSTWSNSIN